ncbi:DUF2508 family protein [Paenibacillus abyssi]|uniref:DUF2508 domain-containing protein n=1 Tax=Paenibacillus abyssi TaxID=1340531 RepID=A0A917G6D0_9BACL|nr:DUF2508 family protein [Paenibacillus abyssi]GGG24989.1 hypothetical protein GCM10010916_46870 [Paenibacillus abyssi]
MKWWIKGSIQRSKISGEKDQLVQDLVNEIWEAHRDWVNAQRHFEYALGKDQVDYAIFAIEAAEKRYEMLLRHAKKMPVNWSSCREGETG